LLDVHQLQQVSSMRESTLLISNGRRRHGSVVLRTTTTFDEAPKKSQVATWHWLTDRQKLVDWVDARPGQHYRSSNHYYTTMASFWWLCMLRTGLTRYYSPLKHR